MGKNLKHRTQGGLDVDERAVRMSADPKESTQEMKTLPPDETEPDTPLEEGVAPGEDNPPPSRDHSEENRGAPGSAIPPQD